MVMNNFQNIIFELYGYLVQLRDVFRINGIGDDHIQRINDMVELIQTHSFNVAVVGEFKRGKSSLINAILGMKILPADATPATATINRITYGSEPSLTIRYHDGSIETADLKAISDYVTMLTEEGEKRAAQIKEAVIRYPTVICQNQVDIIDTPGLNDNSEMTRVTLDILRNIDVVVMAVSAIAPFSEVEKDVACQLIKSDNIENIIFVVTFLDQIDEDEQDKVISYIRNRVRQSVMDSLVSEDEEIQTKLMRIMSEPLIFGVSSHLALKSFVSDNREMLKQSRFETFKTELYELLTSQQGSNMISKAARLIRSLSTEYEFASTMKMAKMEQDIALVEKQLQVFESYAGQCATLLESDFAKNQKNLDDCLDHILGLKNIFLQSISMDNLTPGSDYRLAASMAAVEAQRCAVMANKTYTNNIVNKIHNAFASSIMNFMDKRLQQMLVPLKDITEVFPLDIEYSPIFTRDVSDIMHRMGIPDFQWVDLPSESPAVVARVRSGKFFDDWSDYLGYRKLMKSLSTSADNVVGKMFEDWTVFLSKAKQWWSFQVEQEALAIYAEIVPLVKSRLETMKHDLAVLKPSVAKHLVMVQEINQKSEQLYQELFTVPGESVQ